MLQTKQVEGSAGDYMANAVIPRQQGDDYQARFFWLQACRLFQPHSKVARVGYELDKVKSFDDVVVTYTAPVCAERGEMTKVDYHQVKFHVAQAGAFKCEALTSPQFIGATKFSLLQKLRAAQLVYAPDGNGCRFIIVSPWIIHPDDPLAELVSNSGGEIRLEVLFDGTGPRGKMGGVRALWREHLELADDDELKAVLRPLRIYKDAPNLSAIGEVLNDKLFAVGFVPVKADALAHPYDDLIRKLHAQGSNEFTRDELQEVTARERLWHGPRTAREPAKQIGIRSFMRWAEHMEDETEDMLCLVRHFDDRHIRAQELWQRAVFPEVNGFLARHADATRPSHLLLDTHTSVAFAAGYCLEAKSGADIVPVQRTRSGREAWRPMPQSGTQADALWSYADHDLSTGGCDVAVAFSVTHDVLDDVQEFISRELPQVGRILSCTIEPRPSQTAVRDGAHACTLAEELATRIKRRSRQERAGVLHIFAAAPNALMFFIGQLARGFGRCAMYEYDFDTGTPGAYQASMSFPPPSSSTP